MEEENEDEGGGTSVRAANIIGMFIAFIFVLMCIDAILVPILDKKTSLLQQRIDKVVAANR